MTLATAPTELEKRSDTGRHWLFVGGTGCGKTTEGASLLRLYRAAGYNVVILQGNLADPAQLAEFGEQSIITQERADAEIPWGDAIAQLGVVRLRISAYDANGMLDRLSSAILELGDTVLMLDDQQGYLGPNPPRNVAKLWTEGRHRNVHTITITQRTGGAGVMGTTVHARANAMQLVAFRVIDDNELKRLDEMLPRAGELLPGLPSPGAYVWRNLVTGRTIRNVRGKIEVLS